MMSIILGISGKRESGKSLLASYMEHYMGWTRFSLADELKRMAMKEFKLLPVQLWGNQKEEPTQYRRTDGSMFTGRDILIRMGTFYRSIDTLYWCKKFDPRIGDKIVIDDIRFKNEVEYFKKEHGARFVRLERHQELKPHPAALDDLSETEMDGYKDWDFLLTADNNKVADDLHRYAGYLDERLKLAF